MYLKHQGLWQSYSQNDSNTKQLNALHWPIYRIDQKNICRVTHVVREMFSLPGQWPAVAMISIPLFTDILFSLLWNHIIILVVDLCTSCFFVVMGQWYSRLQPMCAINLYIYEHICIPSNIIWYGIDSRNPSLFERETGLFRLRKYVGIKTFSYAIKR